MPGDQQKKVLLDSCLFFLKPSASWTTFHDYREVMKRGDVLY